MEQSVKWGSQEGGGGGVSFGKDMDTRSTTGHMMR